METLHIKKKGVVFYMSRDFNGSYVRKAGLICGFLIVIAASNFISYRSAVKKLEKMSQKSETYITSQMKDYTDAKVKQYYNKIKDSSGSESVTAGTKNNDKLTVQTIYQVEKYDSAKDISSAEYRNLPEKLVGMNKEQVEAYCHDYMNNMSADEFLAGLQSMGVVSFSSDRLVIKKIYDQTKIKYKYYLIAIDGEVVVYYGDKKTIFDYTGIKTSKLDKKERNALKKGVEVKDEDELYGILENYSS